MPAGLRTRSPTCFYCGQKATKQQALGVRQWTCPSCSATNHVDAVCALLYCLSLTVSLTEIEWPLHRPATYNHIQRRAKSSPCLRTPSLSAFACGPRVLRNMPQEPASVRGAVGIKFSGGTLSTSLRKVRTQGEGSVEEERACGSLGSLETDGRSHACTNLCNWWQQLAMVAHKECRSWMGVQSTLRAVLAHTRSAYDDQSHKRGLGASSTRLFGILVGYDEALDTLDAGTSCTVRMVEPTVGETISSWHARTDGGTQRLLRPPDDPTLRAMRHPLDSDISTMRDLAWLGLIDQIWQLASRSLTLDTSPLVSFHLSEGDLIPDAVLQQARPNASALTEDVNSSAPFPITSLAREAPSHATSTPFLKTLRPLTQPFSEPLAASSAIDPDAMEWTPSHATTPNQSAYNLRPRISPAQLARQSNAPSPFHGALPPAPLPPAYSLRRPQANPFLDIQKHPAPFSFMSFGMTTNNKAKNADDASIASTAQTAAEQEAEAMERKRLARATRSAGDHDFDADHISSSFNHTSLSDYNGANDRLTRRTNADEVRLDWHETILAIPYARTALLRKRGRKHRPREHL
ncbi:hypothetical protein MRB53_038603 [Persea americana]|nr:hypothetical protein MRB53_038603 [Persea americana]